jgi:hypothetical protein
MPIPCELRPNHDATTDQLKALGIALREWARREFGTEGVLYSIDQDALLSLLLGELPNPLAAQVAKHHKDVPLGRILQDLGPLASDRSLRFTIKDGPYCTRERVIESLRQAVSPELVEDILIGDVSWME